MTSYCQYCDPKFFVIYGFCGNCKRRCDAPLYDKRSGMSPDDYEDYKFRWNEQKADLILDAMRRSER